MAWKRDGNVSVPGRSRYVHQSLPPTINTLLWKPVFLVKQTTPNRVDKLLIGFTQVVRLWIDKAFIVVIFLACDWSALSILRDMNRIATYSDSGGRCS